MKEPKTSDRINPHHFGSREDYLVYLRHLFAYEFAMNFVHGSVLELGCGMGYGTSVLSKKAGNIIGLDIDRETVDNARKNYGSDTCRFKEYGGKRIPFSEGMFDVVAAFQVIEYIDDDAGYLSEIGRVMKDGGTLILTTPNRLYRLKEGEKPWNRYHVREYPPDGFKELLTGAFPQVELFGIKGRDEVQAIEIGRVKQSFAISILKKMLPARMKAMVKGFFKGNGAQKYNDFLGEYSTEDFYIVQDALETSLDLLAICRK